MQSKGLIKLLLVLLILVCVIQCSYILPTRKVEKNAENYAQLIADSAPEGTDRFSAKKLARQVYLDSISGETIFSIPLIKNFTYDELKQKQLALGLDLKGGQSAVLQVDLRELLLTLSNNSKDPTFISALDAADQALTNSQSDYITLFGNAFQNISEDKKLARFFYRNLSEDINIQSSDGEVIRVLRSKANETVRLTFNLLKQRIDKLGVTQPNLSLDAARDLILAELPGVDNPERARNMLQASARLEFWDIYRITDPGVINAFVQADEKLKIEEIAKSGSEAIEESPKDTIYQEVTDSLGNVIDSIPQVIDRPTDGFANLGPLLRSFTLNRSSNNSIQFPLAVMGIAERNRIRTVMEHLNRPDIKSLFPRDSEFRWSQKPFKDFSTGQLTKSFELYLIKKKGGLATAPLEGDRVISASAQIDPSGEPEVSLLMDVRGAKIWADMTTKAAQENNREIAIVLDDEVISCPGVRNPITQGNSSISGGFTIQEANDLSDMLEIGKLPAKVKIIQESTVGPSLGAENIRKSAISLVVGLGVVLIFMLLYYGGAGIVSIIALFANLFFIFGALASFGTVLTLPGIAGIVLTIGMAVDANVIIYERVREELRAGKSVFASIVDGFKNSYSAIIDANVTTILVAIVLAYFGLGPIKGFAVVLIIGVLSSLFTAVLLGRMMIDWWTVTKSNSISFWTGWSKNLFANLKIDWLGKRKFAYVLSSIIIISGLISIFTRGFDLGVDFKGGYSYNVEFTDELNTDVEELRNSLTTAFGSTPVVKAVDTRNTYNILTSYLINDQEEDAGERVMAKLFEGVNNISGGSLELDQFKASDAQNTVHITSSSKVGPTIADDIKKSSFYAGIFALLLIFLYIFLRFSKWQYSLGAVAALFHDSLVVLGIFSLLWGVIPISMELDQAFIAALLTVIGYSINDTVVVFDRIREYLGIYTNKSTDEVLNLAINSTFSRTIITSLTTLFVVAILFVFGGGSIKGFALALLIGIIVGTYSSIFVATPILRDLTDELKPKKVEKRKSFSRAVTR